VANIWKNTACIAYSTTLERSDYMSVGYYYVYSFVSLGTSLNAIQCYIVVH